MAQEIERDGRFGVHGGQYIPEAPVNVVTKFGEAYKRYKDDPKLNVKLTELLDEYAGWSSCLYYVKYMAEDLGGAKIYLRRGDLNHIGVYKTNSAPGQAPLAKYMDKKRLIAETGVGQHSVATATVAMLLNMECAVYMGEKDMVRQAPNVYHIRLLGAEVVVAKTGTRTLEDAVSEVIREWATRTEDTRYYIGSRMGPYPLPIMVHDFQVIISKEIKEEMQQKEGRLPDAVIACVGGGNNATGSFYHFIGDKSVRSIGCETAGRGIHTMEAAATANVGSLGIFHGMKSYFCQGKYSQIAPVYSISAGLNYPGVGPERAYLYDLHCARYVPATDDEAVDAFEYPTRTEGIISAVEGAYAVAHARKLASTMDRDKVIVVMPSRHGNKDIAVIARYRGESLHE